MTIIIHCQACHKQLQFTVCDKTLLIIEETLRCSNCSRPVDEDDEQVVVDLATFKVMGNEIDEMRKQ